MTSQILAGLISVAVLIIVLGLSALYMTRKGYPMRAGRIVVRCSQGHLFTTIWIPFVSLKAARLGPVRFQFCPVGRHWTFVVQVDETKLSDDERTMASQYQDTQIP